MRKITLLAMVIGLCFILNGCWFVIIPIPTFDKKAHPAKTSIEDRWIECDKCGKVINGIALEEHQKSHT